MSDSLLDIFKEDNSESDYTLLLNTDPIRKRLQLAHKYIALDESATGLKNNFKDESGWLSDGLYTEYLELEELKETTITQLAVLNDKLAVYN